MNVLIFIILYKYILILQKYINIIIIIFKINIYNSYFINVKNILIFNRII